MENKITESIDDIFGCESIDAINFQPKKRAQKDRKNLSDMLEDLRMKRELDDYPF